MIRNLALFCIVLLALPASAALGQSDFSLFEFLTEENPLKPIEWNTMGTDTRCGPYFVLTLENQSLAYMYITPRELDELTRQAGEEKVNLTGLYARWKFSLIVEDRDGPPTAQISDPTDADRMHVTLRMSTQDYEIAKGEAPDCLPEPRP